jgi:hypothetical protein
VSITVCKVVGIEWHFSTGYWLRVIADIMNFSLLFGIYLDREINLKYEIIRNFPIRILFIAIESK